MSSEPSKLQAFDAVRRDPTGTAKLRRAYRAEAKLRLRQARAHMRIAVMDQDVLALGSSTFHFMPRDVRLRAFAEWAAAVVGQVLSGGWQHRHVVRAWQAGERAAARELNRDHVVGASYAHIDELARIEMQGIAAAIAQRVAREAASIITRGQDRHAAWRRLSRVFDQVGPKRISALADVTAVKAFNGGKMAVYRAADIKRVGVIPEMVPRPYQVDVADVIDPATLAEIVTGAAYIEEPIDVGILTAGDDKVCEECNEYAAYAPYDIDQVEDDLPLHPNCRCTWFPWDDKRFKRDAAWEQQRRAAPGEYSAHGGEFASTGATVEMVGLWQAAKAGKAGAIEKYAAVMKKRCDRIAGTMMLDPELISVSLKGGSSMLGGTVLASTDDKTGKITMFARVCTPEAFAGTLVHEGTHVKYKAYRNAYRAQKAAVEAELAKLPKAERAAATNPDGTLKGELADKYPIYQEFTLLWDIDELRKEGGVSDYSKHWWAQTLTGKFASSAVYETTAEMARIKYETGVLPGGVRHKALYDAMNSVWYMTKPHGFKMIERHEIGGRDAMVAWLTNRFEPADKEDADLAKVVYADGDVQWIALRLVEDALYTAPKPRARPGEISPHGGEFAKTGEAFPGGPKLPGYTHFKPSSNVSVHQWRVQQMVKKTAGGNSTFRWKVSKLIEEAEAFSAHHPTIISTLKKGMNDLKLKMGESYYQQAQSMMEKDPSKAFKANKLIDKSKEYGFKPTQEMLATAFSALKTAPAAAPSALAQIAAVKKPTIQPTGYWTKTGGQKGSIAGGTYTDPQGQSWYIKTPKTEEHVDADMLANRLYELAGVAVAEQTETFLEAAKTSIASKIIPGVKTLAEVSVSAEKNAHAKLREGFAVDAWLANRDVIGLENDNVLASEEGMGVYRIDFGGALQFRAKGEEKEFTAHVGEIASMRDPKINAQSAAVFGKMTDAEVAASIDKVLAIPNETIINEAAAHNLPNVGAVLIARKEFLSNYKKFLVTGEGAAAQAVAELPPEQKSIAQVKAEMQAKTEAWAAKQGEALKAKAAEAAKPFVAKATEAELAKAKKVGQFYPPPTSATGQALVAPWNAKWASKTDLTAAELEQKVSEYKATKAKLATIEAAEQAAIAAKATEQQKAQAAQAKAELAEAKKKAEAEQAAHKEALKGIVGELGISSEDAEQVNTLITLAGGDPAKFVKEFKAHQESGKTTKGLPISPFEYAMLKSYTGSAYSEVNKQLRKGYWDVRTHVFTNTLNTALAKLPPWTQMVKRGFYTDEADQKNYVPGYIAEWRGFSSCGKSSSFPGNMQCKITPLPANKTRARDLGSINPHEAGGEVLYQTRSAFKVVKIQGKPGDTMTLELEEVEIR